MDVKETILNQHKTLKRIEELQEFMHGTSMLALDLDKAGVIEQPEEKKIVFNHVYAYSAISEPRFRKSMSGSSIRIDYGAKTCYYLLEARKVS